MNSFSKFEIFLKNLKIDSLSISERITLGQNFMQVGESLLGYNNYNNPDVSGERGFIQRIASTIKPTVCIDVGANRGSYSKMLLDHTNAKIYAFEPLEEVYKILAEMKSSYGDRFTPIKGAASNVSTELPIYYHPDRCAHASLERAVNEVSYVNNTEKRTIKTYRLDCIFPTMKSIDLIKIDTEGHEYEVLQGCEGLFSNPQSCIPKIIQIEFNGHHLIRGHSIYLFSKLMPFYRIYQLLPNGMMRVIDPLLSSSNIYEYSNFVFVRNDISI